MNAKGSYTAECGVKPPSQSSREHQDHIAESGFISNDWHAMVHQPIPIPKAMRIPKAKEAVDAEWSKLENKRAWDLDSVRERQDVKDEAIKLGKAIHF